MEKYSCLPRYVVLAHRGLTCGSNGKLAYHARPKIGRDVPIWIGGGSVEPEDLIECLDHELSRNDPRENAAPDDELKDWCGLITWINIADLTPAQLLIAEREISRHEALGTGAEDDPIASQLFELAMILDHELHERYGDDDEAPVGQDAPIRLDQANAPPPNRHAQEDRPPCPPDLPFRLYKLQETLRGWAENLSMDSKYVDIRADIYGPNDCAWRLNGKTENDLRATVSMLEITKGREAATALEDRFRKLYAEADAYVPELESSEKQASDKIKVLESEYQARGGSLNALRLACQGPNRIFKIGLPGTERPPETLEDFAEAIDKVQWDEHHDKAAARWFMQKAATDLADHLAIMEGLLTPVPVAAGTPDIIPHPKKGDDPAPSKSISAGEASGGQAPQGYSEAWARFEAELPAMRAAVDQARERLSFPAQSASIVRAMEQWPNAAVVDDDLHRLPARANPDALQALADELRTLPKRGDSEAERAESAGRLLLDAIHYGAFSGPQHAPFRSMIQQRAEQKDGLNGPISAWGEATWRLRGKPPEIVNSMQRFTEDCELVAAEIEVQAAAITSNTAGTPDKTPHPKKGSESATAAQPDANGKGPILHPDDVMILRALKEAGAKQSQYAIEQRTCLSRKTVGERLRVLRNSGLTHRPDGERKGEAITELGQKALAGVGAKVGALITH